MSVQISRDSFARESLMREVVGWAKHKGCSWCGNFNRHSKLFRYGTERDDRAGVSWHKGLFCCKGCHDTYHS